MFVSISGIIGAGKTTLAKHLSKVLDLPFYKEDAQDDPYLKLFYESKTKKYGYQLQISLLTKRFEQQQQIIWNGKGAVQDRSIYEDAIFCKMLYESGKIEKIDYDTYLKLSNIMFNFCGKPTIIIHLDISPEEALKRMKVRNRDIEKYVTLDYLKMLHNAYQIWINSIKEIRIIKINYDKYKIDEYSTFDKFETIMDDFSKKIANDVLNELNKPNIVSI